MNHPNFDTLIDALGLLTAKWLCIIFLIYPQHLPVHVQYLQFEVCLCMKMSISFDNNMYIYILHVWTIAL